MKSFEAYQRQKELENANVDPRIKFKVVKGATGEFYVSKTVLGGDETRIYA